MIRIGLTTDKAKKYWAENREELAPAIRKLSRLFVCYQFGQRWADRIPTRLDDGFIIRGSEEEADDYAEDMIEELDSSL